MKIAHYFLFILIALLTATSSSFGQNTELLFTDSIAIDTVSLDTIQRDSTPSEKSLVGIVGEETKVMKNYFSVTKIIISLIIIILTFLFLKVLDGLLSIWAEKNTKHRVTIKGFIPIIRITLWVGSLTFIIVAVFRPPLASLLAFSASIGVAVGFASQDLLKNIFGGIIIVIDKPFQIGDKIQVGGYYGEVIGIGLRSTRLVTADDNLITVPNSDVMNQAVSNANSGEENCQVVTEIYLPLHADLSKVKSLALETAQTSQFIYLNKPISVLVFQEKIGHKIFLKMKVKAYVNDTRNEFAFMSDITQTLTKEFSEYYKDPMFNKI